MRFIDKIKKSELRALLLLALLGCVVVATTWAYLTTSSQPVTNTFDIAKNSTKIIETIDGLNKIIQVKNLTEDATFVRIRVGVSPSNAAIVGMQSGADSANWYDGGDGFYYYKSAIVGNGTTEEVTLKVEPNGNQESPFDVTVYSESCYAIQDNLTDGPKIKAVFDAIENDEQAIPKGYQQED